MRYSTLFFSLLLLITACVDQAIIVPASPPSSPPQLMEIPEGFPPVEAPEDNAYSRDRWELGKRLFYDTALSVDSSVSCASCHQQQFAFSDQVESSPGVFDRPGFRNSPSLANIAYHPYFMREGGVPTLEMQVLVPIQEHNEFDFNILLIAERLTSDSSYVAMAKQAYQRPIDAYVITRALACFERSLLSGNSSYDRYLHHTDSDAMSASAIRGMDLFFSQKTQCSQCHSGFNFTNYSFANNGLYENYPDEGRYLLTREMTDLALFKVPSLRNVELTAPYMHDGSISTLKEVINHYQSGGKNHSNKSPLIQPLSLSESEQEDLIAFLKALTDDTFINNPLFAK